MGLTPTEGAEGSPTMHRTKLLIASCASLLLDLGVPDVCAILEIQTYRTILNSLLLDELLNLSRKHAVEKDDVASVRVYNCNVTLAVNFARAD